MKPIRFCLAVLVVCGLAVAGFIYSGIYNIAADVPHTRPVFWMIETLREHSIAQHAKGLKAPDLEDSQLILTGGPDYAEMCAGCHLKPGEIDSEIRRALYPQPPNLAQPSKRRPEEMFWVIKHGIKMTAMPAWGGTHDDERMWGMVAFIRKLPTLSPGQYQILTARQVQSDEAEHEVSEESRHSH